MNKTHGNTTLHEIRHYLTACGCAPPAWSDARTQVDALYTLLREKRGDDRFWQGLSGLAVRLEDARVSPALIEGSEVLGGGRVDQLIDDLRSSMPVNGDGPRDTRSWTASSIGITALAAFALLGTSLGCDPLGAGDADAGAGDDGLVTPYEHIDEACEEAIDGGVVDVYNAAVYCEIVDIIKVSNVGANLKATLLDCLPEYDTDEREGLLDAFLDADDEELVELLEDMAWSSPCYEGDDDDH